jgi:hypothetical protein
MIIRILTFWACAIFGASLFVYINAYRFIHPGLTETQLFLKLWPHCIGAVVMFYAAYFILAVMKRSAK